ncbi:uncharacterized protein LOC107016357 [Solanum pennellii]|uniref:Uncharacterized protein LOC107016357 n=1 Tax=Solanum pennellii TaxID=28526 RepID=A0ABM1GKK2_SOLPN|nr:uncharacterized protein LOC107016357 [Solanum pennellii]
MGYFRYLLGIQMLYAVAYTSTLSLVTSENNDSSIASTAETNNSSMASSTEKNDSSIASTTKIHNLSMVSTTVNNDSSLTSPTNNNDSSIAMSPNENNSSSAAPQTAPSGSNDDIVICVRDCMGICMNLDNATSHDCESACRKGCKPLIYRKEIVSLGNNNSSDFMVDKFNKPMDKPA